MCEDYITEKDKPRCLALAIAKCEEAEDMLRNDWDLAPDVRDMLIYDILPLLYAVRGDYDKKDEKSDEKTC